MEINEVLQRLEEGNSRFVSDQLTHDLQDDARRTELVKGQSPWAIILSCADSRVAPELMFDAGLGELFVIRVAGNVANTSSIASIEYAVAHLGTPVIVVVGHQSCGAVTAAISGGDNGYNLNHLLAHITPAVSSCDENANVNEVVKSNALLNAKELLSRSAIIRNAVDAKKVKIVSGYYHLDSGKVDFL